MALEIANQFYMFRPQHDVNDEEDSGDDDDVPVNDPPFHYNPLHDIESIWWVANFFLFHRFTIEGYNREILNEYSNKLFPPDNALWPRVNAFRWTYLTMINDLPEELQAHGKEMNRCLLILKRQYQRAELGSEIDTTALLPTVHNKFIKSFTMLIGFPASNSAMVVQLSLGERNEQGDSTHLSKRSKKR
jgi:hypothetical protein